MARLARLHLVDPCEPEYSVIAVVWSCLSGCLDFFAFPAYVFRESRPSLRHAPTQKLPVSFRVG
jgi:hypothetical protein